jgi:hypothetical protein
LTADRKSEQVFCVKHLVYIISFTSQNYINYSRLIEDTTSCITEVASYAYDYGAFLSDERCRASLKPTKANEALTCYGVHPPATKSFTGKSAPSDGTACEGR